MNKYTKTYTPSLTSPTTPINGNTSPSPSTSSDSDFKIDPLISPVVSPPSPVAFGLNLSDYLPLTREYDDSLENKLNQEEQNIQVITGTRYQQPNGWEPEEFLPDDWMLRQDHPIVLPDPNISAVWDPRNNNITVRRDNLYLLASQLPVLFVTNNPSFSPKFNNFLHLMTIYNFTLGLHSEIWEEKEKLEHQNKIEEALELE